MEEMPSLLGKAVALRELMEKVEAAIEKDDFAAAVPLLRQAVSVANTFDDAWIGQVETLERLGFVLAKLNRLDEAEQSYLQALACLHSIKNVYADPVDWTETKRKCLVAMLEILNLQNRIQEAVAVEAEIEALPVGNPDHEQNNLEYRLMLSFSVMHYSVLRLNDTAHATRSLDTMERLARHTQCVSGSNSTHTAQAFHTFGRALVNSSKDREAAIFLKESLRIRVAAVGDEHSLVAESLRELGNILRSEPIGQALLAKARKIEAALGRTNPVDATMMSLGTNRSLPKDFREHALKQALNQGTEDELCALADEYIASLTATNSGTLTPLEIVSLSGEERFRELAEIGTIGLKLAELVEADEEHPLSIVSLLSDLSECYKRAGNTEEAIRYKEREVDVLIKRWGDEHDMTVDAIGELAKLEGL